MSETIIEGHGMRAVLPDGWSGRIFRHRPDPPEVAGPTMHAGNFAIPFDDADFGTGELMAEVRPGRIGFVFKEWLPDRVLQPGRGAYEPQGFPGEIRLDDFTERRLQVARPGQVGMQAFFSVGGERLGVLYVVLGRGQREQALVDDVNSLIARLEFATTPGRDDYRPVPRQAR